MFAVIPEKKEEIPVQFETVQSWQELMFWRYQEFYDAIEEIEHRTVGDFVKCRPSRYLVRISQDLAFAHVFAPNTREYLFSYVLDPTPDFAEKEKQKQ